MEGLVEPIGRGIDAYLVGTCYDFGEGAFLFIFPLDNGFKDRRMIGS
jgi:hypothetical protein